ncbi:MAG: type I-E CRISPR-associated protein Cse2/CasB [Gordonia sp. (in: high G+C Gram-positive bacteria)]|uniref:type I-E CRISPR-associated protein Cse2/CasB n=1 Tax=Gordonia sp. (in: high G+C Gram-positive bacteria) TaxID=84139 RepID=UPI0039E717AB
MTATSENPTRQGINAHVDRRARELFKGMRGNNGAAIGALAKLRRAATSDIGEDPAAWQVAFLGFGDRTSDDLPFPTAQETGVYLALTTFALHQQSKNESMHVDGPSLGTALNRLAHAGGGADGPSEPVIRRFNALVTADSDEETRWHLRSLIGQLRARSIELDYGRLADDLAALAGRTRKGENEGAARRRVQLQWSRDFSRTPKTADPSATTND